MALPLVVLVDLVTERRTRPDDRHVAAHDVPELRQLVQRQPAQDPADTRDPRVSAVDRVPGAEPLGADDHRAQLEELEVEAVLADARLPVEDGPTVLELDRERGDGEQRTREDERRSRDRDVRGSLHRERLSPRPRLGWPPSAQISRSELARTRPSGLGGPGPRHAGVAVDFQRGDVAEMPFANGSFDLVVCQAAFKNFTLPRSALAEMHRVLRAGGTAVIQDMSRHATHADIDREVDGMELGRVGTFTTKATLEMLKRRAYAPAQFERLARQSPFQTCEIRTEGIGLEVRLTKEEEAK